jgi:2-dehydropantoate 2-reductase
MPNTHTIRHIAILGPGAIGLALAVRLAAAPGGPKVTLIDHRSDRAARLSAQPIRLHTPEGDLEARLPVLAAPTEPPDLVILATKAPAAGAAAVAAASWIGDRPVLTIQNGLGVAEEVARAIPRARVITGVIYQAANFVGEGEVNHIANLAIHLGCPEAPPPLLEAVAQTLRGVGCTVQVEADMRPVVWGKLLVNAAVNPVAALAGVPNGAVADRPALRSLAQAIAEEGEAVARAEGVVLPYPSAADAALDTARRTADNRCSMLQDLDGRRPTEIDYLNGAIVRVAEARGLSVPANRAIAAIVRQVTASARS